jgi:DNA-binding transcriptional LysR family regulator
MQTDQLNGLIALKEVAEKRSFTLAADSLGISPSAVSQIVKQLEERVGVSLLSRTTRSTSLTEAGERFLNSASPAIDQILASIEEVRSYALKPSGLLRLNLPRVIFQNYLAPLIISFQEKYPDVTVELFFEDQTSDVVESGFDAGIRLSDILDKDMVAVKLFGPVRFVTAASPAYLNLMGRPKHPKDLLNHNCLRSRFGNAGLYDKWEFENKGEEFKVQVKGSFISNDSNAIRLLALEGKGIFYTTEDSIKPLVKEGKLEILLNQYVTTSTGFYLYYPKRSQVMPKLRAFVDHLKNEAKV